MRRGVAMGGLCVVAAAAGVALHRVQAADHRQAEAVERALGQRSAQSDQERAFEALLTAGERALAKGQLGAVKLALQSVPDDTAQRARKQALQKALENAERALDAGG